MLLNIIFGKRFLPKQLVLVLLELALLIFDFLVHQRLGERRLISLVMALLAVAHNVHDNIFLELGTPVRSKLADIVDSFDVIAVDMEDRSLDGFGYV